MAEKLTTIIREYKPQILRSDFRIFYGDLSDGNIELTSLTKNEEILEVSTHFGDKKQKNSVSIATQLGCLSKCKFCEIGEEPYKRNLTKEEIYEQVILGLKADDENGVDINAKQLKVSTGRMGDPLFNKNCIPAFEMMKQLGTSFKFATIFPDTKTCYENFEKLAIFASQYSEPVQVHISLISTSEDYRKSVSGIKLAPFKKIREMGEFWRRYNPNGRTINLSLILSNETPANVNNVNYILPPELFRFRFRDYVPTYRGTLNNLKTITQDRIKKIKEEFAENGYIVEDWATPSPTEIKFNLPAGVTRRRYQQMIKGLF